MAKTRATLVFGDLTNYEGGAATRLVDPYIEEQGLQFALTEHSKRHHAEKATVSCRVLKRCARRHTRLTFS